MVWWNRAHASLSRHSRQRRTEMKIAVTGASGLIGTPLVSVLRDGGYDVLRLVRRDPQTADEIQWDPAAGTIDTAGLVGT
ncbi:MAG: NAD-dependent epimerase/dehydratase family protein, partial [Acidimicrobiia bacterium]